jgi:hypothetical protein
MRSVKQRPHKPSTVLPSTVLSCTRIVPGLLLLAALISSPQVTAQSVSAQSGSVQSGSAVQAVGRINGKYTGKIEASADAGAVFNLFMGDRDFDFRTELQLTEDTAGNVSGSAQFLDQKNRRSVGNPTGQRSGLRLRFTIPLRENCAPIQTKALVSAEGDLLQFPASSQVINCSGSGLNVGVRIKLKAFTLAR